MKCATHKLRSPLKWHGGKSYLCKRFINLFPEHNYYLEPFLGSGACLLNKPPSPDETASDVNFALIETWRAIKNHGDELLALLRDTPYSEDSWRSASPEYAVDALDRARSFIVRNRMSRGGLGNSFAWSERLRGGQPGDLNAWQTFLDEDLPRVINRIRDVVFLAKPATTVIDYALSVTHNNGKKILIYADPPYLHETRNHTKAYQFEMTTDDHHDLIACLKRAEERGAKVFLSGYDHPLYREWIPTNWACHQFDLPNHSGQGRVKQRRVECLWESPSPLAGGPRR